MNVDVNCKANEIACEVLRIHILSGDQLKHEDETLEKLVGVGFEIHDLCHVNH